MAVSASFHSVPAHTRTSSFGSSAQSEDKAVSDSSLHVSIVCDRQCTRVLVAGWWTYGPTQVNALSVLRQWILVCLHVAACVLPLHSAPPPE